MTHLGTNQVRIANGAGMIMGGDFVIVQEDLSVALASTGTLPGKFIFMSIYQTTTPVSRTNTSALVQEDLWTEAYLGMELIYRRYQYSDLVVTYENIYNLTGN